MVIEKIMNNFFKKIAGIFGYVTDEDYAQLVLDIRERLEQYNAHAVEEAEKHGYVPAVFDAWQIDSICKYELSRFPDWSIDLIDMVEVDNQRRRRLAVANECNSASLNNEYEIQLKGE
jgi:recombinational DNA repair protein RecT